MKKMIAATLMTIMGLMMTSCEIDNTDVSSNEYREKIANSNWQLSQIMDKGSWTTPAVYGTFDIPELHFLGNNRYEMKIYNYFDNHIVTTFRGGYSISDGSLTFVEDNYMGTRFIMSITTLNDNTLEGTLNILGDEQRTYSADGKVVSYTHDTATYTIRMKRATT